MDQGIQAAIILGVILLGIARIIKTFTDYFLRKKLIELGHIDEKASNILGSKEDNYYSSLKWGIIILFGGLGLVLLEFISYDTNSPFPYGVEAVFIATGFLIYYFVAKKELIKAR